MRVARFLAESRGSTVKIRRNSHYGQSPIAYPLNSPLLFLGQWRRLVTRLFSCPKFRARYFFKEKLMKKLLTILTSVLAVFVCCFVAACGDKAPIKADENTVIITATDSSYDFNNKTLKEFMDYLQDNQEFTYSVNNGMVTTINGKSNTLNSFWMLYTSDSQNANQDWGTFEYEDSVYGSAISGAEELIVKEGCIYIWAYQTF